MKTRTGIIEPALNCFRVLEALHDTRDKAVSIDWIADQTKLSYDITRRCLLTLEAAEYAKREGNNWRITKRLVIFANELL